MNNVVNIIETYSNIECMLCKATENILTESEDIIIKEMINDLEKDIHENISLFEKNSKVYSEMNRSIEKLVYLKKGLRTNNLDLIIESLNNTLCDVINIRNNYKADNRLENIFVENATLIANSKLKNAINYLKYNINE